MKSISEYVDGNFQKCIFCNSKDSKEKTTEYYGCKIHCPNCGDYEIDGSFLRTAIDEEALLNFFRKVPAIAVERNLHGQGKFSLNGFNWENFLYDYPKDFIEKMDRTLVNLAFKSNFEPKKILLGYDNFGLLFLEHDIRSNESPNFESILKSLSGEGLITYSSIADMLYSVNLTIAGLKRVSELQKMYNKKHQAFIAMWFDDTTSAFREATKDAITAAGYKPEVVDENHHNDFIMNKVINMINDSRFVIADLTSIPEEKDKSSGVRGGVYFEAGYAEGRGLPVVLTCEKNAHDRVHFDLKQKSTIFWSKDENGTLKVGQFNYVEYLIEHIFATIGKGPLFEEKVLMEIKKKNKIQTEEIVS